MKKLSKIPLLAWLYIALIVGFILVNAFCFVYDLINMPKEQTLSVNDFELYDLILQEDGTLVSIGTDAQMVYNKEEQNIRSIYYKLNEGGSGVICAYYTKKQGQDYSSHMCLYPSFGQSQEVFYKFPIGAQNIRLDIGSIAYEIFSFEEIVINKKIEIWQYFKPSTMQGFMFLIIPIIIYSIGFYINTIYKFYIKKKRDV